MELENLTNVGYGFHVIKGAYNQTNNPLNSASHDDAGASVIQHLIHGNMSEGQESERYANEAISVMQRFAEAVSRIYEQIQKMRELAEKALRTFAKKKLDKMQEEFNHSANEINDIVENTEYNGNKLFSADGKTISISIGKASSIDIVSKDLSIDIDGLKVRWLLSRVSQASQATTADTSKSWSRIWKIWWGLLSLRFKTIWVLRAMKMNSICPLQRRLQATPQAKL